MPEQSEHSLETLLASIWSRREAGISLPADMAKPITRENIEYLCNYNYPYLQIMNSEANFSEEVLPTFFELPNGWVLFDYENAMCSSYSTKDGFKRSKVTTIPLPEYVVEEGLVEEGDEDVTGGESGGGDGGGTIINQQFESALAMIGEARNKGWAAVEVVSGTALMKFYAWAAAKELGITLYGYNPTAEQERHFKIMAKDKIIKEAVVKRRKQEFAL